MSPFSFAIAAVLATLLGLAVVKDTGYVLLQYGHTTIEMSLWVFVVIALLGLFIGSVLIKNIRLLKLRMALFQKNQALQTEKKAHLALSEQLHKVTSGIPILKPKQENELWMSILQAKLRDDWDTVALLLERVEGPYIPKLSVKVEMLFATRRYQALCDVLDDARIEWLSIDVLSKYFDALLSLKRMDRAKLCLNQMKSKGLSKDEYQSYYATMLWDDFMDSIASSDVDSALNKSKSLKKFQKIRGIEEIARLYHELDADDQAWKWLKKAGTHGLSEEGTKLICQLGIIPANERLSWLEGVIKSSRQAHLLHCAGLLAVANGQYPRGKALIEEAIALSPKATYYRDLAKCAHAMQDVPLMIQAYEKANQ